MHSNIIIRKTVDKVLVCSDMLIAHQLEYS